MKKQGFSVFWGKGHDFADDAVIRRRKVANGGRQIFKRNPLVDVAQPRTSPDIPTGIDRDGHEPSLGVFPLTQGVRPLVGLDKDFLRGILGKHAIL